MKLYILSLGNGNKYCFSDSIEQKLVIGIMIISLLFIVSCTKSEKPKENIESAFEPKVDFSEKRLVKLDESKLADKNKLFHLSKDLSACVYVLNENGKHRIKVNDKDYGVYKKILNVYFEEYKREPVFVVEENNKQKLCVGKSCGEEFHKIRQVEIRSKGNHIAYIGTEPGIVSLKDYLVHDGKKNGPYSLIAGYSLSDDGTQFVAKVEHHQEAANRWKILHNGKLSREYFWVSTPVFQPSKNVVAYAATIKTDKREDSHIIVGDERGRAYDDVGYPIFSPSGNSMAYLGMSSSMFNDAGTNNKFIVRNAEISANFKELKYGTVWSGNPERLGYVVGVDLNIRDGFSSTSTRYFVSIDNQIFGPYLDVSSDLRFSKDGKHFVVGVSEVAGDWHLLVDGQLKGRYDKIISCEFLGEQSLLLYLVTENNSVNLYIGDRKQTVKLPAAIASRFSDDGKKLAYVEIKNAEVTRKILNLE